MAARLFGVRSKSRLAAGFCSRLQHHPKPAVSWRPWSSSTATVSIAEDRKSVSIAFDGADAPPSVFHAVWLKHFCHCPKCRDPHSEQWQQPPESIRGSYTLSEVQIEGDSVAISWVDEEERGHRGTFPLSWLKENVYGRDVLERRAKDACPQPLTGKPSEFDFDEITTSKEKRLDWLLRIMHDGFSLVKNVPTVKGTALQLTELIYAVQKTRYGEIYDVEIAENPENLAYKDHPLPLHSDIPYYESPPGIQLLHCLENDPCVEGGENVIVDLMCAAEQFRADHTHHFRVLSQVPVTLYRVHRPSKSGSTLETPAHHVYHRPLITVGYDERVTSVYWSQHMEGVLCTAHDTVEPFYQARWTWANYMINFPIQHRVRLTPGDLVIFNNRRMVHSRTSLKLNGGRRLLQGCYVNIDDFKSEVLASCALLGRSLPRQRVGNNDFID